MAFLDYLPECVIKSALDREKEALEELLCDGLDPHDEFDKRVLLAVIESRLTPS